MKKLFALVLSCAMLLGLAATAFATDVTGGEGGLSANTEITGTTSAPIIKVIVPATGAVVINPYKMEVAFGDGTSSEQVLSATQYIENQSNVAIAVSVTVTGKFADNSEGIFATAALKGTETTKSVYLYFQAALAEYQTDKFVEPTWGTYDKANCIIVSTKGASLSKFAVMPAATYADGAYSATVGGLAFHLVGTAAEAPAKEWTAADKVSVTVAFTFTAVAGEGAEG